MTVETAFLQGTITRLVTSHGSHWGKLQPAQASRSVFFNIASMSKPADFDSLEVGDVVSFQEVPDHVNGSHAVQLTPTTVTKET